MVIFLPERMVVGMNPEVMQVNAARAGGQEAVCLAGARQTRLASCPINGGKNGRSN